MGWQVPAKEEKHHRLSGVPIVGTGTVILNLFQVTGTVRVLEQVGQIAEITTLNNLTNMYATLYDGTTIKDLTADGAELSGLPVGTSFTKDKVLTQPYSVLDASECQASEVLADKRLGKPFTAQEMYGGPTFMQFRFKTTDTPVSFKLNAHFIWKPVDGGNLILLG